MSVTTISRNPLALRFISTVVGAPLFVAICVWGERPFIALTLLLALTARYELHRAYERLGIRPNALLSLLGALAPAGVLFLTLPLGAGMPSAPLPLLLIMACGLIMASLWETGTASETTHIHTGRNMAYGLMCGAYVSLFGGVALLRITPWHTHHGLWPTLPGGAALVLLTATCTIAGDASAFFVGRTAGKHKLAEVLSPRKTTEGLAGGMLASVLFGCAAGALLIGSAGFGLLVGLLGGILGPLGDLFKSALKREIGIKDFGEIIPGHGGVLDRFDSLMFTAPVVSLIATSAAHWT